jgi:hypothetical protein
MIGERAREAQEAFGLTGRYARRTTTASLPLIGAKIWGYKPLIGGYIGA